MPAQVPPDLYRSIVEAAQEGVWVIDADAITTYVNPKLALLLGYEPDELVGRPAVELAVPEDHERALVEFESRRRGEWSTGEWKLRGRNGTVPVLASASSLFEGERFVGAVSIIVDLTERKQVEHALRESEERFRRLAENEQDIIYLYRLDPPRYEYVSPAVLPLIGYTPAECYANPEIGFDVVHPDDRALLEETIREQRTEPVVYRCIRKDGTVAWMEDRFSLVRDDHGRVVAFEGVVRDITAQKQAEEALRESEERFRRLADNAQDIIYRYRVHPDRAYEYLSPAAVRITGYTPEEAYANPDLGLHTLHPDDRANLVVPVEERTSPTVYRWIRRDGATVWIEDRHTLVRNEDGVVVAVEGVARDITAQRRAEEEVKESEARFRAVFDNAIVPMIVFDDELRYVNANPAACALVGLSLEEMLRLRIHDLSESAEDAERFREALLKEGQLRGQYRIRVPDGTVREVEFNAKANVQPGRHLAVGYEVTERKQLEAQLRQAQRMEAIGRLAGGVAHDFNNQLAAIMLYADLALANLGGDVERSRRELEGIQHVTDRAASLTRQLLAFGRRQILNPSAVDLNDVVVLAETMLGRLIGERIMLDTVIQPELDTIVADPAQLEQLIVNLVVNARDAISANGTITIRATNADLAREDGRGIATFQPGRYVVLTVSDTGRGMDAETRAHVFEPFFTTKPTGEGTGLGLATAYGFVKQTGGYIWVDSEPGQGTTVTVAFPGVSDARPARLARTESTDPGGGTETVLLVEDEDIVRAVTAEILENAGYTVLPAANGRDAFELADAFEGPIDVLLTDWIMPEMGGPEIAMLLRSVRPDLRVIFMSGYAESDAVLDQLERGDTAFLAKPFSAAELARMLRHVIEGTRAETPLGPPPPPV